MRRILPSFEFPALASLVLLCACGPTDRGSYSAMSQLDADLLLTAEQALEWHAAKDAGGPTYAGNESWLAYLELIESSLRDYGAVDFIKNPWTYDRWHTSDWPDDSGWSLVSGGEPVRVAHYAANSGSTPEEGVTARLLFYDPADPPESLEGRIVVFWTRAPDPDFTLGQYQYPSPVDYEYISDPETFPDINTPRGVSMEVTPRPQMRQVGGYISILRDSGAAGALFVLDAGYERLAGLYTFPVNTVFGVPALYIDREAGPQVVEHARSERTATLRLVAPVEPTETYQLLAHLPGRDYGTDQDEMILLVTHTDGPSISQENGPFGLMGIVHYFSSIPQNERSRTLLLFMDNRHYMPGAERVFSEQNWFAKHPDAYDRVVGVISTEHLGQLEYREVGDALEPTGLVEHSMLHVTNNDQLVGLAIQAVREHDYRRVSVHSVGRLGINGGDQGNWYGLGGVARRLTVPGAATMGSMGAYWGTSARLAQFDAEHFVTQVAVMTQLTAVLMTADLSELAAEGDNR